MFSRTLETFDRGRALLSTHVFGLNRVFGVPYLSTADAPNTYPDLVAAFRSVLGRVKGPGNVYRLRVFSGGCEGTIYPTPEHNYAFRAWHDTTHVMHAFDFSLLGEMQTCETQCDQLERYLSAVAPDTDPNDVLATKEVLRADIVGQARHFDRYGHFPSDQLGFDRAYFLGKTRPGPWHLNPALASPWPGPVERDC